MRDKTVTAVAKIIEHEAQTRAGELLAALETVTKKCDALEHWIQERNKNCDPFEETIPPEIENELTEIRTLAQAKGAR